MKNRIIKGCLFCIFIVLIFLAPIYSLILSSYSDYHYEDITNKFVYMRTHPEVFEQAFQQFRFPILIRAERDREFLAVKVSEDEEYWYNHKFDYLQYKTKFYNEAYQQMEVAEITLGMTQRSVIVKIQNHGSTFSTYIAPDFITPTALHGGDDGYIEADQKIKEAISAEKLLELYEKGLQLQAELEKIYDDVMGSA